MQIRKKLILLLLLPLCLCVNVFLDAYTLSICAIFHNEAAILKEWIVFHKLQGVQHFYLYNNSSTDNFEAVLQFVPAMKAAMGK